MPQNGEALSQKVDRIKKLIEKFPAAASTLNNATDQLGKSVGKLDAVLKKFSLGVPTWVPFYLPADENCYYKEELGYAKIGGRWGVAVRTVEFNQGRNDNDLEQWLFNDAPRLLRVRAVDKIPELLEALLESAGNMSKRIAEKAEEVDIIAAEISSVISHQSTTLASLTSHFVNDIDWAAIGATALGSALTEQNSLADRASGTFLASKLAEHSVAASVDVPPASPVAGTLESGEPLARKYAPSNRYVRSYTPGTKPRK